MYANSSHFWRNLGPPDSGSSFRSERDHYRENQLAGRSLPTALVIREVYKLTWVHFGHLQFAICPDHSTRTKNCTNDDNSFIAVKFNP